MSKGPSIPVKVTQRVGTFRRLLRPLKQKRFGCFIVWIREHEAVKVAEVNHPELVERAS